MADDTDTAGATDESETTDLVWYERYSWLVFVVIGLSGLLPAVQLLVDPSSGTSLFAGFGHPVPDSILSDPTDVRFLEFVFRWIGTVLLGSNLLTIFIAVTAWRNGAAWAWVAL